MKKEIKEKIIEILNETMPGYVEDKEVGEINFKEDVFPYVADQILELLEDEYKNGYNQCLKDLGKTGERWLHLYL